MRIMVFDVPAVSGGALTVLKDFYQEVKESNVKNIEWIFIISEPYFEETSTIKIMRFPWIKKSWLHRIFFDQVVAPKLINKYKVDKVFSLQNLTIPRTKISQTVYLHQSLPFAKYKFKFKENKLFWIYQNIISKNIFKSIKKAEKVIVQTKWMKKAVIAEGKVREDKVIIVSPNMKISINKYFKGEINQKYSLFYPAGPYEYKNHQSILEALKILKEERNYLPEVIFTLSGDENAYVESLSMEAEKYNLPIKFIGSIKQEEVFEYYTNSILLFPSYIETFGLPLLEAKLHRGIILASNQEFSKEVLLGYENAYFFNPFDYKELANLIKELEELKYTEVDTKNSSNKSDKGLVSVITSQCNK